MKFLLFTALLLPAWLTAQNRYDIVIDEIMADPSPHIGLPDNEWIELKNTSPVPVNLGGWHIGDASGQSGPIPDYILQPDSLLIVCTANASAALSAFGPVVTVTSFPALSNEGERLSLKNNSGMTIHAVDYSAAWYANAIKQEGGWSLEMIDTKKPCTGSNNWKAAVHPNGGTPGQKNSVTAETIDDSAPQLKNAFIKSDQTLIATFDETADSLSAATIANYSVSNGLTVLHAVAVAPLFDQVELQLSSPMSGSTVYKLTANNITGCKSSTTGIASSVKTGIPANAGSREIVINEILFNPRSNGYDYVEVYNRSDKIVDAAKLYIATRDGRGIVASSIPLARSPIYIFPGDYFVATEDAGSLYINYLVKQPANIFTIPALPSFADDAGNVVLLNLQGEIIDEVNYSDDWHFPLIINSEGVSLERIDPGGPSQEAGNWHSAASTAGYGTPTYTNSQFKQIQAANAIVEISPEIFSPDNDGRDDIATIRYKVGEPGYVANVTIYDGAGRPVRNLVRNSTMAPDGYWNWDGLNDKGLKLPAGAYIALTEIFNLQGKKNKFKHALILTRKLK